MDQPPVWFVGLGFVGFGLLVLAMVCWFWVVGLGAFENHVWTSETEKQQGIAGLFVCFSGETQKQKLSRDYILLPKKQQKIKYYDKNQTMHLTPFPQVLCRGSEKIYQRTRDLVTLSILIIHPFQGKGRKRSGWTILPP